MMSNSDHPSAAPATGPAPTLAPVIPITYARRVGGPAWRRIRGLQTVKDLVDAYLATHVYRDPALIAPLPEDRRGTR